MLVATLTMIPAADLVKERLSGGLGGDAHIVLPVIAAVVSGIVVAAVFAVSVRMSGLGVIIVGALLIAAGIAFLAAPAALMNVDPGSGYWHALSTGSSWISISGGFPAAGAVGIGIGIGAHQRRRGRTAGPAGMSVAGVLLAIAGSLFVAYAGTGSTKPAVFLLSAKVGDAELYRRMLFEPHYLTLLAVLAIGLILLVAAGSMVRWSAWSAIVAGALVEIPVLVMVIRPGWIISGSGSMLHSGSAGTNIGEFILFGGLGLVGVVLLGGGAGTLMIRPALAPDDADDATSETPTAAGGATASGERGGADEPSDSALGGVRDDDPERDVDEELRPRE